MTCETDCIAIELFRVKDVIGRRQLVSLNFGPNLQPLLLTLGGALDYRIVDKLGASFPKLFASKKNEFYLHYQRDGVWMSLVLPTTPENFHSIQPLPGSRWVAVRARAKDERDLNAHVFDSNGNLESSFHAGDGIRDVQVADDGMIWVSFFDEGVYSATSTGRSGLIAFDEWGKLQFDFEDAAEIAGSISDCYALNVVSASNVWAYYYTDFPLVRLQDGVVVEYWNKVPVEGAGALAIGQGFVVLAGAYNDRNSLFRLRLSDISSKCVGVYDENGRRLKDFQAFGRGNRLFLLTQGIVYAVDVSTR